MFQAILLGLVAMIGNAEYLFGTCLLSRPIVMGTLTGIVLGDIPTGVSLGATLELAFMGAFSIGASIPPETALTVGLPVASLVLIAKNIGMVFILPPFVHKADDYAKQGNMRGVALMHFLGGFFGVNLIIGLCVGCGFYAGGSAVEALLNMIPDWVNNGLQITMGLLPAIGFGLLLKMIMNKELACFFLLGFALSVYLGIPTTGIAIFGAIIAIVLTLKSNASALNTQGGGLNEDDDF